LKAFQLLGGFDPRLPPAKGLCPPYLLHYLLIFHILATALDTDKHHVM